MVETHSEGDDLSLSAEAWLARVRELERNGELLRAYDAAEQGLEAFPEDLGLKHRAALVLARSGATASS